MEDFSHVQLWLRVVLWEHCVLPVRCGSEFYQRFELMLVESCIPNVGVLSRTADFPRLCDAVTIHPEVI